MKRRDFLAGSVACSLVAWTGQALAQSGPLTKIIFPFAAGGGGDALCRLLAQHIAPLLDRNIIVENRTGGDGLIGIKAVKGPILMAPPSSSPRGRRCICCRWSRPRRVLTRQRISSRSASSCGSSSASSSARPFRPRSGTSSIRRLAESQSGQGHVRRAQQRHHSAFQRIAAREALGIKLTRVAYRGSAPIINDLVGGHMPFAISTLTDAIPQHRAGNVRILAVGSATRSPFLPDAPTLKESGVDLVADAWYGMWLPAARHRDFAKKLSEAAATALAKPRSRKSSRRSA
jgi:tripartite-type tricarboxylate transporter receptor subunit TctC